MPVTDAQGKRDKAAGKAALAYSVIALVALALPYAVEWLMAPAGRLYTGAGVIPNDAYLYQSALFHGGTDGLAFKDHFTYIQWPPVYAFTFYTALGSLFRGGIPMDWIAPAWHGARLVIAAAFASQTWLLYKESFRPPSVRRLSMAFLLFTAGLGFYQLLASGGNPSRLPFDLDDSFSSSFAGLLYAPHFAAVLLCFAVFLRALARAGRAVPRKPGWLAAGFTAAFVMTAIHPEKLGVLALASFLYLAWLSWAGKGGARAWGETALMLAGGAPWFANAVYLVLKSPLIAAANAQGGLAARPGALLAYSAGYGLPLLLAAAGAPVFLRRLREAKEGHVALWCLALGSLPLLLLPLRPVQDRGEGMQMALAGLAAYGLAFGFLPALSRAAHLRGKRRPRARSLAATLAFALCVPSVPVMAAMVPRAALLDAVETYPSKEDAAAISWVNARAGGHDVIVGSPATGAFFGAYSRAYAADGQFEYTPGSKAETLACQAWLSAPAATQGYPKERGARWLAFGPREASYRGWEPSSAPFLRLAWRQGATSIYEFRYQ